jgi:hypothetical protein
MLPEAKAGEGEGFSYKEWKQAQVHKPDKVFSAFERRIKRDPEQVIR